MITNGISLRPSKQEVTIQGCENVYYGSRQAGGTIGSVRRTQTTVLRAPSYSTVIWPGQYLELDLPDHVDPNSILALVPRKDCSRSDCEWPSPHIVQAVARKIRIPNQTRRKRIPRHDHLFQVFKTGIRFLSVVVNCQEKRHSLTLSHLMYVVSWYIKILVAIPCNPTNMVVNTWVNGVSNHVVVCVVSHTVRQIRGTSENYVPSFRKSDAKENGTGGCY
ncbi:Hypothetical predicted protein [Paramuricea clavata]|uniref:Uncharacterized protein n=1 Tax=Paramuricea clavata TaxID=317549 RepID=A0A7D9ITT5_PARCT|nr:Hypothetical predicted protein [Paramuricea clavata]